MKVEDIAGKKYSRLTAIEYVHPYKWLCQCECGGQTITETGHLKNGHTKSCGCRSKETQLKPTHGLYNHPIYKIHKAIRDRCYLPSTQCYQYYGGRGIVMCDEWLAHPEQFIIWAIENGWKKGLQIDRINNDGPYSPSNCRWVAPKENMRNTRRNHWVEHEGKRMIISDWLKLTGTNKSTFYRRLRRKG